jgi:hypothetical protein
MFGLKTNHLATLVRMGWLPNFFILPFHFPPLGTNCDINLGFASQQVQRGHAGKCSNPENVFKVGTLAEHVKAPWKEKFGRIITEFKKSRNTYNLCVTF